MTSKVPGSKFPTDDNFQINFKFCPCDPFKGLSTWNPNPGHLQISDPIYKDQAKP